MNSKAMREMAKQYPSKGLFHEININSLPFEKVESALEADENVKIAFGANAGKVGRLGWQSIAICITDKRIILCAKLNSIVGSVMNAGVKYIRMDNVNSVGVQGFSVEITTIGDDDISVGNYDSATRDMLVNKIEKIINDYKSNQKTNSNIIMETSSADELKKFKDLLDSGIITQEEFDAKKKQLLGL